MLLTPAYVNVPDLQLWDYTVERRHHYFTPCGSHDAYGLHDPRFESGNWNYSQSILTAAQ